MLSVLNSTKCAKSVAVISWACFSRKKARIAAATALVSICIFPVSLGAIPSDSSYKALKQRDAERDSKLKAKPLERTRSVNRWVTPKQASHEKKSGIAPDRHFTSSSHSGRPESAANAKSRYGLGANRTVRETVVLPKGSMMKKGKAIGGEPGRGEIVSAQKIDPKYIKNQTKVK